MMDWSVLMGLQLMVQDKTGPLRGGQRDLTLSHLICIGKKYLKIALMFILDSNEIKWRSFLKLNIEAQLSLFTFLILICCLIVSLQLLLPAGRCVYCIIMWTKSIVLF